jgi:hypothetical protein
MPVDVASHYLEEVRRQFRGHKLRRLRGVSEAGDACRNPERGEGPQ